MHQVIRGRVIHGEKVGRTIGFPTANIDIDLDPEQIKPGVYVGTCQIGDKSYNCLPYFGPRLIFGETQNIFEVYIYNFDREIYDEVVEVTLLEHVRKPLQVDSMDELKKLLESDKMIGLSILTNLSSGK